MEENFLISVIILNWNGIRFLETCLDSLASQSHFPVEILVVDNGSTDGSPDRLRSKFPAVKLIENGKNLGFGGGMNVGILTSRGKYVMILNNDTRLDPRCLEELGRSIEKDERYGAAAAKILLEEEGGRIDAAGIAVCPDGLSIGRGRLETGDLYDRETEVFFSSGCACLYRREMLEDIGLFDEDFFAYAEDTDLGWRARLGGWKCIYSPKAIVYHLHSASSESYSPLKAFLVERNRIWVAIKNFPLPLLILGQFYTLERYFWQAYGAFLGRGAAGHFSTQFSKRDLVKILLRVYLSFWKPLPLLLRKRRMIRHKRRISNREVYRLLKEFGISAKEIALRE
jgi:GT2 family glycosyltransferase